jgi:sugar phosphate isomerase/epimerase
VKLGFNTNGLQNHRLEDALALLADHGYEAVALTLDVVHLDPFRCSAAEVGALAKRLAELRLTPVVETGARYLLDPRHKHEPTLMTRGAARQRRLDYLTRAAAIGRDLGASVVSFWSGIDRQPGPDSVAWLDAGIEAAVAAIRHAGLVPALEPEPGMAVATVADWQAARARLGSDAPALCLDVGHLYVVREAADPIQSIRAAAADAVQVHLEDIRAGVHEHLPPGEGDVDFPEVLHALAAGGYRGPVCFELSRSSHAAPESVRRCAEVWRTAKPVFPER